MTVQNAVSIRPLADADEPAVLGLLQDTMSGGPVGKRTSDFFRWKHYDNPFGRSPALVAEIDGRIVGLRTFLRWEFASGESTLRAVRAVDTATHPSAQGRGVFRELTTTALDTLGATTDFVFNTPNQNSLPGYLRMGWQPVGEVPIAVRPLRWGRFVRHLRTLSAPPPTDPRAHRPCPLPSAAEVLDSDRLAGLLGETVLEEARLHTRADLEYLRWRYARAPGLDYRAAVVESGHEIVGVAFGRPRRRGALTEFTLTEILVRPGDRDTGRRLLREVARCGADHVATHLAAGHPVATAARRSGYLTPPRRGMLLVARPFRAISPDPCRLESWRLSLGDLEVF